MVVIPISGVAEIHLITMANTRTDMPSPPRTLTAFTQRFIAPHQPSLSSFALAGLLLSMMRMLLLFTNFLRHVPSVTICGGYLEDTAGSLSIFVLVYVGLTGEAARVSGLIDSTLKIAPLSLTLPFTLTAYLFVAHTLSAPDQALETALLAGTVTALVGLFCVVDARARDNNGMTALHIVSSHRRLKAAEFLLENAADVNAYDNEQYTPLYYMSGTPPPMPTLHPRRTKPSDGLMSTLTCIRGTNPTRLCYK
ncbi:hypothetical protein BGW80DRAFT_1556084 [Lactifluus volemus]|nr:hypothetical protein BGW80DRAFT_1556084 [Lactifluus volemus]